MADNKSSHGGRKNPNPLGLDTHDPKGIAEFGLGLGYDADDVTKSLVDRCNLDEPTARRIVEDAARDKGR